MSIIASQQVNHLSSTGIAAGGALSGSSLTLTAPVTKTANFIVQPGENFIIVSGSGTVTVTLPSPSSSTGRIVTIKSLDTCVMSASSNVVPLYTAVPGPDIIPSEMLTGFVTLVSDGTNWVIMM